MRFRIGAQDTAELVRGWARRISVNEDQARAMAEALGGQTWQSGGGIWLVVLRRRDGSLVVNSDEVVCEYADDAAFEAALAGGSIALR